MPPRSGVRWRPIGMPSEYTFPRVGVASAASTMSGVRRLSAPRWSSVPQRPQLPTSVLCASAMAPPIVRYGCSTVACPAAMGTPAERIGATVGPVEITIDGDRVAAFAEAIGDPEPSHRSGEVAPLTYVVVPTFDLTVRTLGVATEGANLSGGVH